MCTSQLVSGQLAVAVISLWQCVITKVSSRLSGCIDPRPGAVTCAGHVNIKAPLQLVLDAPRRCMARRICEQGPPAACVWTPATSTHCECTVSTVASSSTAPVLTSERHAMMTVAPCCRVAVRQAGGNQVCNSKPPVRQWSPLMPQHLAALLLGRMLLGHLLPSPLPLYSQELIHTVCDTGLLLLAGY